MSFGQFNTEMRESEKEKEKGIGELWPRQPPTE